MADARTCGCKGIRTCLLCEEEMRKRIQLNPDVLDNKAAIYEYCYHCNKAYKQEDQDIDINKQHPKHSGLPLEFPGVLIIPDFVTEEEERELVEGCDSMPWDLSQSGRRKQNFGPKTNFNKRKINGKEFSGFPDFSKRAQERLKEVELLKDFRTIEQCSIEYRVETGASIDPHIDDCWVWGERVVSISLLSDSFLTMTKYMGSKKDKYNLSYAGMAKEEKTEDEEDSIAVLLPMPRRSLIVLYGPARYEWEHSILRRQIKDRRICMAYREFTPDYLQGGKLYEQVGKDIITKANYFGIHNED